MIAVREATRVAVINSPGHAGNKMRVGLQSRLRAEYPTLCAQYPIEDYIQLLDEAQEGRPFFAYISPRVLVAWQDILAHFGAYALELYHRATMLTLIDAFDDRIARHDYPPSIIAQFRRSFLRIEKTVAEGERGTYWHTSDRLLKDLSLCRQTVFPGGGAWVVECHAGFPRSTALRGGLRQFLRLLFVYLFVTRGHRPFYSAHVHGDLRAWHTPAEWAACYARIAEMLQRNPGIKGVCGCSWLLDPTLDTVSPRLAYLRRVPQDNGAWVFRMHVDIEGGALEKSPTRRRLFRSGGYLPTSYLFIWPRRKVIAWARRRAEGNHVGVDSRLQPDI